MAQEARLNLRMQRELNLLLTDPPHGASFPSLASSSSLSSIHALIEGPEGTVYAKGLFNLKVQIPERYPFQPPIVTFLTPIYHPNIDNGGRICLDILNLPPKVPTVNQVYAMINQDENQRIVARTSTLTHERANPTTMLTSRAGGDNYKPKKGHNGHSFCDYCHMKGHSRGDCNKLKNFDYCHLTGHVKGDCYRLIGYPAYFKGQSRENVVTGSMTGSTHLFDANSAG